MIVLLRLKMNSLSIKYELDDLKPLEKNTPTTETTTSTDLKKDSTMLESFTSTPCICSKLSYLFADLLQTNNDMASLNQANKKLNLNKSTLVLTNSPIDHNEKHGNDDYTFILQELRSLREYQLSMTSRFNELISKLTDSNLNFNGDLPQTEHDVECQVNINHQIEVTQSAKNSAFLSGAKKRKCSLPRYSTVSIFNSMVSASSPNSNSDNAANSSNVESEMQKSNHEEGSDTCDNDNDFLQFPYVSDEDEAYLADDCHQNKVKNNYECENFDSNENNCEMSDDLAYQSNESLNTKIEPFVVETLQHLLPKFSETHQENLHSNGSMSLDVLNKPNKKNKSTKANQVYAYRNASYSAAFKKSADINEILKRDDLPKYLKIEAYKNFQAPLVERNHKYFVDEKLAQTAFSKSKSRRNFAAHLTKIVFTPRERLESNCNGRFGKKALDPVRLLAIRNTIFTFYPCKEANLFANGDKISSNAGEMSDETTIWIRDCQPAIDESNRVLKKQLISWYKKHCLNTQSNHESKLTNDNYSTTNNGLCNQSSSLYLDEDDLDDMEDPVD